MSPVYKPSGIDVNVLDNPRLINLGETVRIPAIVGIGPTTRSVVDEAVQRSTGSVDYLSVYPTSGVTATQIANTSGVISGGLNAVSVSANGALYSMVSGSVGATGTITWSGSGVDVPATGSVYYVSYAYSAPSSQYDPGIFSDMQLIRAKYGAENTTDGILTIAGNLVLEQGAPGVMLVQASGSASNISTSYKTAIDKLQTKTNIEQLVLVFPANSCTRATQESVLIYAYTHVQNMSQNKRERGLVTGSPSAFYTGDGFDVIGDTSTNPSYVYRAQLLKSRNVVYVVPSRAQRKNESGTIMELDGNFCAAAVAGVQTAQNKSSTPIHGFVVAGLTFTDEKWNEREMDQLGAGNCTVLESRGGIATIRDFLTTDPTSANTIEPSIVSQERLVKRRLRDELRNVYTNKGKVITKYTPIDIEGTTYSILQTLVTSGDLFAFGIQDNPATGEVAISAKQNIIEPRQIDVTCSVKYLYPLKWVIVSISTWV